MELKQTEKVEIVNGHDRYSLCPGIESEIVIAQVLENVYLACDKRAAMAAWDVANALKYLLRLGKKDDIKTELGKAENYIHHARTGVWLY